MKTRAAVAFAAKKPLEIVELDLEGPKAGEVLVEIKATGICHTDAYTLDGFDSEGIFPSILGHRDRRPRPNNLSPRAARSFSTPLHEQWQHGLNQGQIEAETVYLYPWTCPLATGSLPMEEYGRNESPPGSSSPNAVDDSLLGTGITVCPKENRYRS